MTQFDRAIACLLLTGSLLSPTSAQDAPPDPDIMLQARKCLKVPGVLSYGSYRAWMVVTLEGGIPVQIRTTEFDPQGEAGRSLVDAAKRAIEQCGPYAEAEDGNHVLAFESEE